MLYCKETYRFAVWSEVKMTFEEAFDYIRSLSSMKEDSIREVLQERSGLAGSEFLLADEDSGMKFNIKYTNEDGFIVDALF